ncbi:MAG: MGMT family protein [Chloroflexi bacterium]|nr:MGMT family protein [Chloroflexota bacterium]
MTPKTILHKLETAPAGSFHVLDGAKATRIRANTMYVPSPRDIAEAIRAIPYGHTRSLRDIRHDIAVAHHADITCPSRTTVYWKWLAHATVELCDTPSPFAIPWWRVLKEGKLSQHMPGGVAHQRALLQREGVIL